MNTLQEYRTAIEALEGGSFAWAPDYGDGEPWIFEHKTPVEIASERCHQAYSLQGEIRRILWSPPYRAQARELAERCRLFIEREKEAHDLIGPSLAPRFPATVDPCTGASRTAIY